MTKLLLLLLSVFAGRQAVQEGVIAKPEENRLAGDGHGVLYLQTPGSSKVERLQAIGKGYKSIKQDVDGVLCGMSDQRVPTFYNEDGLFTVLGGQKRSVLVKGSYENWIVKGKSILVFKDQAIYQIRPQGIQAISSIGFRDAACPGANASITYILRCRGFDTYLETYALRGGNWYSALRVPVRFADGKKVIATVPGSRSIAFGRSGLFCLADGSNAVVPRNVKSVVINPERGKRKGYSPISRVLVQISTTSGKAVVRAKFTYYASNGDGTPIEDFTLESEPGDRHRIGIFEENKVAVCIFGRTVILEV